MKKLLLLGALLVVGATSFSAVTAQPTSKQNVILKKADVGDTYSGEAELQLITKGTVVAPGDNQYMLVITPTQSSEMNNDSIAFNFADIKLGETSKMVGGFKAQIYGNNKGNAEPTGVHLVDIKDYAEKITTKLEYLGTDKTTQDAGVDQVIVDTSGKSITGIHLDDLVTGAKIGTLSYALTTGYTDDQTLEGEIVADITAGTTNSGSFRNMEAKVVVKVDAAALPVLPNQAP